MNLRKIYKERTVENVTEFRDIHDHMCRFLVAITVSKSGAYAAVQEWDIQSALRYYLPPPLSGIDLVPFTALNSSYSKLGEITLHQGGQTNSGFQEFSSSLEQFTKRENRVVQHQSSMGFVYRLELMELPPSYFEICSNLCAIEQGIAFCFMDGFLRRALEKLTILNYQLSVARCTTPAFNKKSQQGLMPIHPSFPWEARKSDFCSCLQLIKKTANNTQQKYGASNDLILNPLYDTVGICYDVVCMKIKRDDELILLGYEVLAALARDAFRIFRIFEQYDLFSKVREEMISLGVSLPKRGAEALLDIIYFSTLGLTSQYIVQMIPKLREPLIKVARIYSTLDDKVRRTNWTLTKSAMLYKNSVDPNFVVDDLVGAEIEEFVRTGSVKSLSTMDKTMPISLDMNNLIETAADPLRGSTDHVMTKPEFESKGQKKMIPNIRDLELMDNDKISISTIYAQPGTYAYCGTSNCGSLRFPDQPCDHGEYGILSEDQKMSLSLKLPITDGDDTNMIMPVSKISAREKGLRDLLAYRKGKAGLSEVKKYTVHLSSSPILSKSKPNKLKKDTPNYGLRGSDALKTENFGDERGRRMICVSVSDIPDLMLTRPPPKG